MNQIPLVQENAAQYMDTGCYKVTNAYSYCNYLNSGLLEAPCEYILHGLVPGLN
jgi:hypothetical protein